MADGISLTLGGDALLYLEAKAKELLGKDPKSRARRDEINRLQRLSLAQASSVQCVGMAQPIPIDQIYQPTRLRFEGPQTTFETRLAALKHKQQARKQASDVVSPAERRATTTVSQAFDGAKRRHYPCRTRIWQDNAFALGIHECCAAALNTANALHTPMVRFGLALEGLCRLPQFVYHGARTTEDAHSSVR